MFGKSKLLELRRKTDRDLVILVRKTLHRALTLADVATSNQSPLYAEAERGYELSCALLQRIPGLDRKERRELESGIKQLRSALDAILTLRARPACAVAGR
jgi:hypothetical protein